MDFFMMFYMALRLHLERKLQNIYVRIKCVTQTFRIRLNSMFFCEVHLEGFYYLQPTFRLTNLLTN
jgi:hypothetical protein